jgi:uncharacterized membrane protein YkvI
MVTLDIRQILVPLLLALLWLVTTLWALYKLRLDESKSEVERGVWTVVILIPIVGALAFLFVNSARRQ